MTSNVASFGGRRSEHAMAAGTRFMAAVQAVFDAVAETQSALAPFTIEHGTDASSRGAGDTCKLRSWRRAR